MPDDRFEIVFVCTGNRARSPFAASRFRQRWLAPALSVRSAGVLPSVGETALDAAIRIGRRYGVDLSTHEVHPLERRELRTADLVVGFERSHLSAAVVDGGSAIERTFLLIELAGLLGGLSHESGGLKNAGLQETRELIAVAHANRSPNFLGTDEVPDPFGLSDVRVEEVFDLIDSHVAAIGAALFGNPRSTDAEIPA
jgi:protein-tyrosine phosphatase